MDLILNITKERAFLLREYAKLEVVDQILRERKKKILVIKSDEKEVSKVDKATFETIRSEWRGSFFSGGIAKIESAQERYFEHLSSRIRELCADHRKPHTAYLNARVVSADVLITKMRVYSNQLVRRLSRGGTIASLIDETTVDFLALEREVALSLEAISALVALIEHVTIKDEANREKMLVYLQQKGFPAIFYPTLTMFLQDHWYDLMQMEEEVILQDTYLFYTKVLPSLDNIVLRKKLLLWSQAREIPKVFLRITNGELIYFELVEYNLINSRNWFMLKEIMREVLRTKMLNPRFSSGSHTMRDGLSFVRLFHYLQEKYFSFEQTMTICKAVVHSRAGQFFDGKDILDFCLFAENLVVLVQQNKIDTLYAIDRSGRLLGILYQRMFKELGIVLPLYFIHGSKYNGDPVLYSVGSRKSATPVANRRILLIDEYVEKGTTFLAITGQLQKEAALIVPCALGSQNGGYHSVTTWMPEWQKKKEYTGLEDWDGNQGLLDERRTKWGNRALPIAVKKEWNETAKNVRGVLLKLAPVITQYIKTRTKH